MVDAMIEIEIKSGTCIRSFHGKLAELKRLADHNEISQRIWLTAFQLVCYRDEMLLKLMSDCTRNELVRLGILIN